MENLWQRFGILIFVGFGLLNISYARPIGEIRGLIGDGSGGGDVGGAGAWLTGVFWPSLIAAAVLVAAGGAALVGCCACCRKSPKGFQEFTDSGSSHSLSTGGYVNPAASSSSPANEFTIFPPTAPVPGAGGGGPVSFEPLPDIKPRQTHGSPSSSAPSPSAANPSHAAAAPSRRRSSQKKPAAFNNAVSHGLSAQDWFDDPHDNFPRSQLKYLCEFGKGWFGRVVEGEALGLVGASNGTCSPIIPIRVIVKILHGDATPTDQMYFLHEVRYLRDLTPHPNILQLLGRCLETDPFLIMLEACPNGDLKTFLLQNLATAEALSMQGVILRMACNVAAGLQHMHERGFVHTDLAARNCLVAPDLTVKIGDYGTSIENFKDDYYCAGDVALPIRWCAPETLHCTDTTIETKEVTASANIWSLGVLLWEVCEFGRLPYSELNDEEVIVKVLSERSLHLGPPSRSCLHANNLYHLMRLCWNPDSKRPGITQVAAMLDNLYLHPEELPTSSVEDFEHRWAITKPNGTLAMVETVVHEPPLEMQAKVEEEEEEEKRGDLEPIQRNMSPSPHPSLHGEPLSPSIKHKSPSLQNLRGSIEDLVGCSSPVEEDVNKEVCSSVCELDVSSCDIPLEAKSEASWLHDGDSQAVTEDDEDAQFVRKISEAIRDLDDVLALEKTSSSSGSGTSPEEHSPTKKRFAQQAHEKVDENGVLDFRLGQKNEVSDATNESIHRNDNVTKELPVNTVQMDSLLWDAETVQEEPEKASPDENNVRNDIEDSGQNSTRFELNQAMDCIKWKVELDSGHGEVDTRTEKPKTAMEVAQEEEEEAWRQRVERGEFTAKVREKSRSVQDLMVLTHIEDSSEGSDSEGGMVSHGKSAGSPPPGPLLPSAVPSFGSVGDLRTAVLGEEFRHTLERLCAANKRRPMDRNGSPLKKHHPKLSEEPEEKRENVDVSREFDEQAESSISSQNSENVDNAKEPLEVKLDNFIDQLQHVDSAVIEPSLLSSKDNVNAVNSELSPINLDDKGEICADNVISEIHSPSKVQHNQFETESSQNVCGLITSTPLVDSNKRQEMSNEDSFLFNLTPLGSTFPVECTLKENCTSDSSVSTVDPTFPESDETVYKTASTEIHVVEKTKVDIDKKLTSDDTQEIRSPDDVCDKSLNYNELQKTAVFQQSNIIVADVPVENLEIEIESDSGIQESNLNKEVELLSDIPLTVHNSIVNRLSVLAEQSISKFELQSHLNEKVKSPVNEVNASSNISVSQFSLEEKVKCIGQAKDKDYKSVDQMSVENFPQDSPMNEFPGDGDEQSPLHALTCGISGSQSTVECRSPLALSPVTVGVEDILTPTSAVVSYPSKDSMTHSSNDTSPCEEKFKNDGVTKEINSDFIFTVDATVENMDAVVKPDLLLDSERIQKERAYEGCKVPSSLLDTTNISKQENVVETFISNIEVDKNCNKSWNKPQPIDKDIESSHLLLDLVQINSNGLQNLSSDANVLSSIINPKEVSAVEKSYPTVSNFSAVVKDFNGVSKSCVIEKEILALEKDCVLSDAPNSEECDSAGTEDSVFDFSPPVASNGTAPIEVEGCHLPKVKQIRFLSEGEEGICRFSNEKNDLDMGEIKECTGEEEDAESQGAEGGREDDEDEELGLLGTKQWTPDDERSSDSGFRDKGSLSESVEDACERCDLADVETGVEEEEEMGLGGGEATAEGDVGQVVYISCDYPEELSGEAGAEENAELERKNSQLHYPGTSSEENSFSSSTRGEAGNQDEFWRQQIASLKQAAGDTAALLREASAPADSSSWIEGEIWDEDGGRNVDEMKMLSEGDDGDRGLDEASLAALRSELQEKLGGSNSRFGSGIDLKQENGSFERANSEERLSDEDEEDGEGMNEERTDITIHYDAYLAQLSPILEERESVGSSELYSPATKEPPRDSVSDDSATTASVNDIGDNQVFSSDSNIKDPALAVEDVLIVDTSTNQASLMVSSPIYFHENDATSPEFTDSLEDDDDDDEENKVKGKPDLDSPKNQSELQNEEASQKVGSSAVRYAIPPSDFWSGMNNLTSNGGQVRPLIGSPLLLPPPPSSAPMPSPEEERAGCVERAGTKNIPLFRDFEDIVALCQSQGEDFGRCDDVALEGLRSDSQRSSEEMDVPNMSATPNLPFWESESSDGNDSSSSGEFVWKEGEREIPPARTVENSLLEPASRVYESLSEFPMAVIEEEDEDETCDGEDGKDDGASDSSGSVMEFIPSAWNSAAEPSRSSLRSPDRKSDQKKNVSFKRQKYHCVYEYPKEEASDSEGEGQDSPTRKRWDAQQQTPPFDYSSYADWELMEGDIPEGIIPGDVEAESEVPNVAANHRQFDFYKLSSEDYDFGFATVTPEVSEGEFMVSSSSRPFQYCAQDSPFTVGSQFFPGLSLAASNVPRWVAGRRSPWSKNGEENADLSENIREEVKVGDNVPDLLADTMAQDPCHGDGNYMDKIQKSTDGGTLEWSSQQPLPSPVHSSSSSGSLSSCSPPASPLSPTGLGELRHTRDRLKLDLPHKFSLSEVARGKGVRKEVKTGESAENSKVEKEGSTMSSDEVKELKVRRRVAEEQRGEASLLDVEKEREGITKTAL